MKTNSISFTSRINFIPERVFDNIINKGSFIDWAQPETMIKKADSDIWTYGIRTCTAGGIINSKTKEVVGFHIYDNEDNFLNIDTLLKRLFKLMPNADGALIIGGKDIYNRRYSTPIFNKIKEALLQNIPNVTIFEKHKIPNSESNICYSALKDEWYLNTIYSRGFSAKLENVKNKKELCDNFEKIQISKNDILNIEPS